MRSHDRPQADIHRSIAVGIVLVAALLTAEAQAFPVRYRDFTTPRTTAAGVVWIDQLESNPYRGSLVAQEELSLSIRPAMDFGSQVFSFTQRRVPDVAEVFADDVPCPVRDRVSDQLFRCSVEHVHRYGSFVTAHPSEKTARGSSANGLDGSAGAPDAGTMVVFHPALEKECAAVRGICRDHQTLDAEIHADDAAFGFRLWNIDFVGETEKPHFANALNLGILPSARWNVRVLQDDWFSKNSHALLVSSEVSLVRQRHCRALVDAQIPFAESLHCLVAARHMTEQGTGQLRGDSELLSDDGVESTGESVRVHLLRLEHLFRHQQAAAR